MSADKALGHTTATIDLYYWTTPNGHKITIFLEEAAVDYKIKPVDITKGDQFTADFLAISPNNRIPAIVDHQPAITDQPLPLFESGAILEYLADKTGLFLPAEGVKRYQVLQWLYWQMGGLGPMAGQNHHFSQYAPEKLPYAIDRYVKETSRLYGVLNGQLQRTHQSGGEYICGDYSIADMASYPWVHSHEKQGQNLDDFPYVKAWFLCMSERSAVIKAYKIAADINK